MDFEKLNNNIPPAEKQGSESPSETEQSFEESEESGEKGEKEQDKNTPEQEEKKNKIIGKCKEFLNEHPKLEKAAITLSLLAATLGSSPDFSQAQTEKPEDSSKNIEQTESEQSYKQEAIESILEQIPDKDARTKIEQMMSGVEETESDESTFQQVIVSYDTQDQQDSMLEKETTGDIQEMLKKDPRVEVTSEFYSSGEKITQENDVDLHSIAANSLSIKKIPEDQELEEGKTIMQTGIGTTPEQAMVAAVQEGAATTSETQVNSQDTLEQTGDESNYQSQVRTRSQQSLKIEKFKFEKSDEKDIYEVKVAITPLFSS